MKEYNYTITLKITITDQEIKDILESAWSAIYYWADKVEVTGQNYRIHDLESGRKYNLTIKKLIKALKSTPGFKLEEYDMFDADELVQKAIFGKVVYG